MAALETTEARIYKALDKFEAVIQHNESPIDTWAVSYTHLLREPALLQRVHRRTDLGHHLPHAGHSAGRVRHRCHEQEEGPRCGACLLYTSRCV